MNEGLLFHDSAHYNEDDDDDVYLSLSPLKASQDCKTRLLKVTDHRREKKKRRKKREEKRGEEKRREERG